MSFIAMYESDCENCEQLVEHGQEARMVDYDKQLVAHVKCPVVRPQPTCPSCFLQHAGECL